MSEWPHVSLGSVTSKIGSGATPRGGESVYAIDGVALVRSQNVLDNAMKTEGIARIGEAAAHALRGVAVQSNDVLINITGDSVARCAMVDPTLLPARVNQHVAIVRTSEDADPRFVQKVLVSPEYKSRLLTIANGGGTRNALTKTQLSNLLIPFPPLQTQRAIAEVLGALDDKIAANTGLAAMAGSVARMEMRASISDTRIELSIADAATLITRGIAPKYTADGEGTLVLNQKCVRDQRVSLTHARWTDSAKLKEEKRIVVDDVLVNSTGQGTLGRVARWTLPPVATVDSHITIVRPDPAVSDPAVIGQAILAIEADIEALGEGSTGQTELSRVELGRARIRIPVASRAVSVASHIRALTAAQDAAYSENRTLAATRDALLPQLMSGKLRVRDAERIADEAGA